MDHARIAELLEPFLGPPDDRRLTTGDLDKISTYIDLLLRWNARINLTAIRDPDEIVRRHFGESFFLARHLCPDRVARTLPSAQKPDAARDREGHARGPQQARVSLAKVDEFRGCEKTSELDTPGKGTSSTRADLASDERRALAPEGSAHADSTIPAAEPGNNPAAEPGNNPAAERHNMLAQGVSPGLEPNSDQAPEGRKNPPSDESETAAPSTGPASRHPVNASLADRSQLAASGSKLVRAVDLGSGAGFPALPLKIWALEIHLTLIESNHKKAAFLREIVRALTLTNVDVIAARAESIVASTPADDPPAPGVSPAPERSTLRRPTAKPPALYLAPADIVTFRAVEKFDRILPLAANFLNPEGRLALLIGSTQLQALQSLPRQWEVIHIPESHNRLLAIGCWR